MKRWAMALVLVSVCGCGGEPTKAPPVAQNPAPVAPRPEPKPPSVAPRVGEAPPLPEVVDPPPEPEVEMVREVARAGVSDKGRYDAGIVTTPLTAAFSLEQQIIFDAKIPKLMEAFEGTRNRKPSSHQEFMQEIIAKGNVRLPSLPPQHRYVYDPKLGELMVERPKTAN